VGSLKWKLENARVECPPGSEVFIIPISCQESLITEAAVIEEVGPYVHIPPAQMDEYVQQICSTSRTLFGVLACVRRTGEIIPCLNHGISDEDLPLRRNLDVGTKFFLEGKTGKVIPGLGDWEKKERIKFRQWQREMTAPVFIRGEHYELDVNSVILPFTQAPNAYSSGGYSEILIREIHPSHHKFWTCNELEVS
jgi:hypothetical protein